MTEKANTEKFSDLDILEEIENNPDATQASMADQMNVAIGTINWHLKRLIEKGYIKIQRCEKRKLKYIITPEGIALRARLAVDYIHSSFELYRLIRSRMNSILDLCIKDGYHSVFIDGEGDVREICGLTCMEKNVKVLDAPQSDAPTVTITGLKLFYNKPER